MKLSVIRKQRNYYIFSDISDPVVSLMSIGCEKYHQEKRMGGWKPLFTLYIYIQKCFGLLGLISAVLMLGWRYSYVATSNDPTLVVSFKPCRSAQTRELASMRKAIYIHKDIHTPRVVHSGGKHAL